MVAPLSAAQVRKIGEGYLASLERSVPVIDSTSPSPGEAAALSSRVNAALVGKLVSSLAEAGYRGEDLKANADAILSHVQNLISYRQRLNGDPEGSA